MRERLYNRLGSLPRVEFVLGENDFGQMEVHRLDKFTLGFRRSINGLLFLAVIGLGYLTWDALDSIDLDGGRVFWSLGFLALLYGAYGMYLRYRYPSYVYMENETFFLLRRRRGSALLPFAEIRHFHIRGDRLYVECEKGGLSLPLNWMQPLHLLVYLEDALTQGFFDADFIEYGNAMEERLRRLQQVRQHIDQICSKREALFAQMGEYGEEK